MPKFDRDALAKAVASQTLWTVLMQIVHDAAEQEWSSAQCEATFISMWKEVDSVKTEVHLYDMMAAFEDMYQLKLRALEREKQYVVAVEEVFHV